MTHDEFNQTFKSQTAKLTYEKQLLFAINTSKKLFVDYQAFSVENQWGDPDVLLYAISVAEAALLEKGYNTSEVNNLLSKINDITPDTEDFGNTSYALNAGAAVYETLEFLVNRNLQHLYNIGFYLTDTVYFRIQEDADLTAEEIDEHPMMVEARRYLLDGKR